MKLPNDLLVLYYVINKANLREDKFKGPGLFTGWVKISVMELFNRFGLSQQRQRRVFTRLCSKKLLQQRFKGLPPQREVKLCRQEILNSAVRAQLSMLDKLRKDACRLGYEEEYDEYDWLRHPDVSYPDDKPIKEEDEYDYDDD